MKNTHTLHTHKKKLQKASSFKGPNIWHTFGIMDATNHTEAQ